MVGTALGIGGLDDLDLLSGGTPGGVAADTVSAVAYFCGIFEFLGLDVK